MCGGGVGLGMECLENVATQEGEGEEAGPQPFRRRDFSIEAVIL